VGVGTGRSNTAAGGSLWRAGAFRTAGPGGHGPLRGYPPAPGAPDPVYPPGQFSPWNSPALRSARTASHGAPGTGAVADAPEPDYSMLAVSDAAADATATQTWSVLDETDLAGEWTSAGRSSGAGAGITDRGTSGAGGSALDGADEAFGPAGRALGMPGGAGGPVGAGMAGYAAADGYPVAGAPAGTRSGQPRPGGRLAARRDRQAAENRQAAEDRQASGPGTADPEAAGVAGRQAPWAADPGAGPWPGTDDEPDSAAPAGPRGRTGTGGRGTALDSPPLGSTALDRTAPEGTGPGRGRAGSGGRRPGKTRKTRKPASRARMWLMPLVMMVIVAVLIAVAYLHFVKGRANASGPAPSRKPAAAGSPSPTLGPWKHITTRAEDAAPLALTELFPAQYSAGGATVKRTVEQAKPNCARWVLGAKLQAAVRKADCSQVLRASYLSASQKIMATIGVLNLADVTGAQRAGQATGATAFIKQLPGPTRPTRNLNQGTGLEEAQIKGHYLILTWAEFTNLKAPANAGQRAQLDAFSRSLVGATANISLTSRMLFGKPQTP
jgi:hypothetical protein